MKTEYKPYVDALIELAIREDIGDGDHTSLCCIPADERGRMRLLCKQEGIIAGIEIARLVLERLDPTVEFDQRIAEARACVRATWPSTCPEPCARCCRPNASCSTSCSA